MKGAPPPPVRSGPSFLDLTQTRRRPTTVSSAVLVAEVGSVFESQHCQRQLGLATQRPVAVCAAHNSVSGHSINHGRHS